MTTICHDHFLNINLPLTNDIKFKEGFKFLEKVAKGLKLYDHPTDIEEVYKLVNEM